MGSDGMLWEGMRWDGRGWDRICRDFPGYKRNLVQIWENLYYFVAFFYDTCIQKCSFSHC